MSSYAFLRRWLLPSRRPGCHSADTSFATQGPLGNLSDRSGLCPSRPWTLAPMVCLPRGCHGPYSEFAGSWSGFGPPVPHQCSTPVMASSTLYRNRFRRKPANSRFDWLFTPRHRSSPPIATEVSAVLHLPVRRLQPAHGEITWFRVKGHGPARSSHSCSLRLHACT